MAFEEFDASTAKPEGLTFDPSTAQPDKPAGALRRLKQGIGNTVDAARVAATNSPEEIAGIMGEADKNRIPASPAQVKMQEEIAPYVKRANEATGVVDNVLAWGSAAAKRAGQFIQNPSEFAGMVAENLPNSAPGMAGGLAGAAVGSSLGPVGTAVGGVVGGTAGGYAVEQGSSMQEQIQKEAQARGVSLQDKAGLTALISEKYPEFLEASRLKGIGTAGTDAVLNVATMGIAGAGGRAIAKEARTLGEAVKAGKIGATEAAQQLAGIEAKNAARNTLGATVKRGAGITGAEMLGEGASEAVGQKLGYGNVDAGDVIDESLLGLGTGVGMAASQKVVNKITGSREFDPASAEIKRASESITPPVADVPPSDQSTGVGAGMGGTEPFVPPAFTTNPQPTTLGTQITATAGPGFDANSVLPKADPVRDMVQQAADAGGPNSAAALVGIDSGAHEIQFANASAADQAAYNSVDLDSADKPITHGQIAEAAMSDDDKRAVLYSNQPVADGGQRYPGTQDGDILNGSGAPFSTWQAAGRRATMEGKDWTIAKVADGFVARRKDATDGKDKTQQDAATPDWESSAIAEQQQAPATLDQFQPQGMNMEQRKANLARLKERMLAGRQAPAESSATPAAAPLPQFQSNPQPTTLGTQTTAKAGPGFDASYLPKQGNQNGTEAAQAVTPETQRQEAPAATVETEPQVFIGKSTLFDGYGASHGSITEGNRRQLMIDPSGGYFWGDWHQESKRDVGAVAGGVDKDSKPASFTTSKEAREAANKTPAAKTAPAVTAEASQPAQPAANAGEGALQQTREVPTTAETAQSTATGGFDAKAWDKAREIRIKASKKSGAIHLDDVNPAVESMRGKVIHNVHDPKERGVVRTVDNNGNVYIQWSDEYSGQKNSASKTEEPNKSWLKTVKLLPIWKNEVGGKTLVLQTSLGPTDLKDYVFGEVATTDVVPGAGSTKVEGGGVTPETFRNLPESIRTANRDLADLDNRIEEIAGYTPLNPRSVEKQIEEITRLANEKNRLLEVGATQEGADLVNKIRSATHPQPAQPGEPGEGAGAPQPTQVAPTQPALVRIKSIDGKHYHVQQSDLDSGKSLLPTYTANGKRSAVRIHRENLDPTGEKQAANNAEDANNPLFNVIATKNGAPFGDAAAANRALKIQKRGDTHEVVPASEVKPGMSGFVLRRKVNTGDKKQVNKQVVEHSGLKISQQSVKIGDTVQSRWVVQSPENAEREAKGERQIGGDAIVDSREEAVKTAERETARYAEEKARKAEFDRQEQEAKKQAEAKKEANRNKSLLERRADAILDKPTNLPPQAGLGTGTRRESMDKAVSQGRFIEQATAFDSAAKKKDTAAVDLAKAKGYILGLSNENIPVVKAALEAQARLKENKYEKPEYRVYSGSDRNGSFYEISKTEYDYAQSLKEPKAENPSEQNKFAEYNAHANQYGYEVLPDGAIGLDGKFPGTKMVIKNGRLRIESGSGDLLASYPAKPEKLGKFLESFWYAEKRGVKTQEEKQAKPKPTSRSTLRADYFTPGNVVKGYSGYDRVIDYKAPDEKGNGWSVTVQHVINQDGKWVVDPNDSRVRTHSTHPDVKDMAQGPVYRAQSEQTAQSNASTGDKKPANKQVSEEKAQTAKDYIASVDQAKQDAQQAAKDAPRETVTPAEDKPIGKNDAGEQLYERKDGSVYRMRDGKPDFGGDLAPKQPSAPATTASDATENVANKDARYKGPSDVSSRDGQMELANRAGTIATLKAMNDQLRRIAPDEAWHDRSIEDANDLDALRDQISQALVNANRKGGETENPLRKKLESLSGDELKAVFAKMNLAGKILTYSERIDMLMHEDAKDVEAAIADITPTTSNSDRVTGPKVNLLAAASELGVELSASVRAALEAKQEGKVQEAANDRDHFTLERLNRETNQMEPVTFTRGEYVRYKLGHGEIDGISHARREFSVDGLWYPFGYAYKAQRPAEAKPQGTVPLSSVIDKMNAKHGAGLTDADRVPTPSITPRTDAHAATMQAVREGTATPEQFKASFEAVVSNKDAIKAELMVKTKAELLKDVSPFSRLHKETKAEIVDALYGDMVSDYALGATVSYVLGRGGYESAVRKLVEATDTDKLAQYVKDRKAAMEEYAAQRAAKAAALENPQTLDDYRNLMRKYIGEGKTSKEAFLMLTPEQRVRFDELSAESTRESREARKRDVKTEIRAAGQTTGGEIIATKHTRDGYDLFVVKLAERVSKEDYATLLGSAKRMGGWYSAFRGNGAIPGFQFKDKANAEAFLKLAAGDTTEAQAKAAERRDAFEDDRSQSAVERLTEMADRLEERATEALNAERKVNTARRARFAASAEASANSDSALAKTMRNIAQAISDGKAKFLDAVRQKVQVEMLRGMVRTAKDAELRAKYPSYADQEKHRGEKPTDQTADFAEFPSYTAFRSDLASLARQMLEVDGTKKLGQSLMKVADDVTDSFTAFAKANSHKLMRFSTKDGKLAAFSTQDKAQTAIDRSGFKGKAIPFMVKRGEWTIITSPSEAINQGIWKGDGDKRITLARDFGNELVQAIGRRGNKQNQLSVPWQFENANTRLKALSRMGIETSAEFRSALREFIRLQEQPAAPDKVKELERSMVGRRNDGMDFFPTPQSVADEMVQAAGIEPGMRVLEPSAGMGHIAERIRESGVEPDVVEMANDRRELLEAKGFDVVGSDFLATQGQYDRIVMNPPFSDGRDILHVQHAYTLLKPGGRLVAIMGESAFTNQNKRATEFREWLESVGGTEEKLPDGSFMDPSLPVNTGVNARMVVIDKQAEEAPAAFNSGDRKYSVARPLENGERASSVSPGFYVNGVLQKYGREIDFNRSTAVGSMGHAMVKFSRTAQGQANGTVEKTVADIVKGWATRPKIVVAFDMNDERIPERVRMEDQKQRSGGASGAPEGFYYKGTVYLMSSKLATPEDVARVLFHEALGHHGLRSVFGKKLNSILNRIAMARKSEVDAKMAQYGLKGISKVDRLTAAEEILAEMAQTKPNIGFVREAIAAIRTWLRENIPGFKNLELTDDEIIRSYIVPARNFVERGGTQSFGMFAPSMARDASQRESDVSPIGFYSALARGIEASTANIAPALGWKATIKGLVNKGLAKSDEVEWSGVNEWLDMQGGKVAKTQVLDFLRGNGVQVQEVTLSGDKHYRDANGNRVFDDATGDYVAAHNPAKYEQYTLPGGTNYREVLLTFPGEYSVGARIAALRAREVAQKMRFAETDEEYELLRKERAELAEKSKGGLVYKSSHWDQPNVLAHIRLNDRTDADGKRVLFVEEVQSDWGQQGKKEGFAGTMEGAKAFYGISDADWNAMSQADRQSYVDEMTGRTAGVKGGVPTAPFVTKTDAWLNLALKRIIKMAVDEGYDKVAFVNGEQSAARYDLSKQVDSIEWDEAVAMKGGARVSIQLGSDMQTLYVDTQDGNIVRGSGPLGDVAGKSLDDVLGKEIAKKILSSKTGELRDDGLKVGGEGMKAFYDQIVPSAVKKLVGKLGVGQMESVRIGEAGAFDKFHGLQDGRIEHTFDTRAAAERWAKLDIDREVVPVNANPQPGFTINPAMREKVADGLPLFSRAAAIKKAGDVLNEAFNHPGTVSKWHTTVGSMYNLAERSPAFKPVFDAAQNFLNDVSYYATEAADMAPKIMPKLESWKDMAKSPISYADNEAIGKPIFQGTLSWARDVSGKPVRIEELEAAAADMTTEQKAQDMLRAGKLDPSVLRMWQGMKEEQYAAAVNSRYESTMLRPGVVWTDSELKRMFNLNDAQIGLYKEFRKSIDASIDNTAKAGMLRVAGKGAQALRDMVMDAQTAEDAGLLLRDHFQAMAGDDPKNSDQLIATANQMMDLADKAEKLKKEGYAPLSRFGQYTVDVVVDGERKYFGLFESKRAANQYAAKAKAEFGAGNVAQGTLSQREFEMFQGITPESLELFGNMLGLDSEGSDAQDKAFQTYLRMTKANRSAMKKMIHRKGIEGYSEDVGRVLAAFVYSNARQTAGALNLGRLGEAVNDIPKAQGELKDVAIGLQQYITQPQEEAQAIRGLMFAQYLGGSVASALVNLTQPMAVSFPYLSQFGGAKKSAAALTKAYADMAKNTALEKALQQALHAAEEQGVVAPQEVHQLMAQARGQSTLHGGDGTKVGDFLAKSGNAFTKLALGWGKLFGVAEQINRRATFIAAYRMAVENGNANPAEFATKAVNETQFINNRGNKMQWGRGAVGATLMTFKSYSINYLELLHRMATQNGKDGKMAAALMLGMLVLMAGAGGLPFAEDLNDLVDFMAERMGYNFSTKKAKQEFLENLLGKPMADFVDRGITGLPGSPIDVSGRMSMANLIPGTGLLLEKRDHSRDAQELLGPVGDMAKRAFTGANSLLDGDIKKALLAIAPKAISNAAQGFDMSQKGYYADAKGYKVLSTTPGEAVAKAIGFQPQSVSMVQESNAITQRMKDTYALHAEKIRSEWAKGVFEHDPDQIQKARDMLKEWNDKNPDQRIIVRIPDVMKKARDMAKDKDQRIADTAPKAMRAHLKQEIMQRKAYQ